MECLGRLLLSTPAKAVVFVLAATPFLPVPVSGASVECHDMFVSHSESVSPSPRSASDAKQQSQKARSHPIPIETKAIERPDGLELSVWRYNSGLEPGRDESPFSNAQFLRLTFDKNVGAYQEHDSGTMRNNRFIISPAQHSSNLRGYGSSQVKSDPVASEMESGSHGQTIFERNQDFVLGMMQRVGYLSEEEHDLQISISKNLLKPEQVTFVEATERIDSKSLRAKYGKIPDFARESPDSRAWNEYRSHYSDYKSPTVRHYDVKVGSSWLISGQIAGKNHKLGLEALSLQHPIDRSTYKFIWEVGRAGQDRAYGFPETLRANLFLALHELILTGGDLDDAFIFAHALDESRASRFRDRYGMKDFSRYTDPSRPDELVLVVPLKTLLELFPLTDFSASVRSITELLPKGAKVTPIDVYRLILESRELANQSLQLDEAKQVSSDEGLRFPVFQIRDYSTLPGAVLERDQKLKGLSPTTRREISEHLLELSHPVMEYRDSLPHAILRDTSQEARQLRHDGMPVKDTFGQTVYQTVDQFLTHENALEVFSPSTNANAMSGSLLLVNGYAMVLEQLRARGIENPFAFLQEHHVRFAVTIDHGSTVADDLPHELAHGHWFIHRESATFQTRGYGLPGTNGYWTTRKVPEITWTAWSFDVETLERMRLVVEKIGGRKLPKLITGPAQNLRFMSQPLLFMP